jgi:hypothetical protein
VSFLRKQIRHAIIRRLLGQTAARERVRENRGETNWQENLPAINVYFKGEPTIIDQDEAPRRIDRRLELEVEILVTGKDGEEISDRLDDLAEQVERCLSIDDSIEGCADDIILKSVSEMEVETAGTFPNGKVALQYEVRYYTFSPRDRKGQGSFNDLDANDVSWDIQPGQADADQAKDTILPLP